MTTRIAYLTGEYPRATDTFIQREVAALRRHGFDIETMAIRGPALGEDVGPEQQQERRRTFYVLPPSPVRLVVAHLALLFSSPPRYFGALWLAWKTRSPGLAALAYQLFYFLEAGVIAHRMRRDKRVHLHNHFADSSCSAAMLAAALGGFSYSFTLHGPYIFFAPQRWALGEKVKRASFVSCISHYARSQAMIFAPPKAAAHLHIVHCGVEPALFDPKHHAGQAKKLLFVGRLAPVKGLPVLLEALAMLHRDGRAFELTVVGDGPDRAMLEARAREMELADAVCFVGYRSQAQVREHLKEADVFVMASFAEGVPVVLMEAMAAGLPVVAPRIAGIAELVEDGHSGYLAPPGDAEALAEKITLLLGDAERRQSFGRAGRAMVEQHFNIEHEAAWLGRIITASLEGRRLGLRPDEPASPEAVENQPAPNTAERRPASVS